MCNITRMGFALVVLFGLTCMRTAWQRTALAARQRNGEQVEAGMLVEVLRSKAPIHEKALACKRLAVMGGPEAIPVLASLLSDEKLAHYARFGLEPIPDPRVDQALRDSLRTLDGQLRIGVINSIGSRRDARAVESLSKLLNANDPPTAAAAAAALGRIATVEAAQVLRKALDGAPPNLQASIADACLACAEQLVAEDRRQEAIAMDDAVRKAKLPKRYHVAATCSAILARQANGLGLLVEQLQADDDELFGVALHAARQLDASSADVARALISEMDSLPTQRQVLVLIALGDLGDPAALPNVLEGAKSGPTEVRVAALRSLRQLADASAVAVLFDAAVEPEQEVAETAAETLASLPGNKVDAAILERMKQGDRKTQMVAIRVSGQRRIRAAVPALLEAAKDSDEPIRLSAIAALGQTIQLDQLGELADRVIAPETPQEADAARRALQAACIRMPDRDQCAEHLASRMPQARVEAKRFLLELLGKLGGSKALEAVQAAARDADPEIQDAATRVLGDWMSPDAAPELLELAKTLESDRFKIRALRGYIRIIRQFGLADEQRVAMCRRALDAAQRDAEKQLVLEVLGRTKSAESLAVAITLVNSPTLKDDAIKTAVAVAREIVQDHPDAVASAMRGVLNAGATGEVKEQAEVLLEQATK